MRCAFGMALLLSQRQHLYKRIALDACRAAITSNVKNWAWAMFRGVRGMGYDMVISATDMVYVDVQCFRQVFVGKVNAVWQDLDYCPRTCPSHKARLCTYQAWCARPDSCRKSLIFTCHCLPRVSGRCSGLGWVVMACLAMLVHGQESLVLTGCADFAGLAQWVMRNISFLSVRISKILGTNIQDCLGFQPWCNPSGRMIL